MSEDGSNEASHEPSCTLLVVWHSRTGASEQLARAAHDGGLHALQELDDDGCAEPVHAIHRVAAADAEPAHVLAARGFLFVCPENLAAMSGQMKEFFDRCYYPILGRIEGRPYGCIVSAGSDGSNAVRQIARIATGWRLRQVAEPVIVGTYAQTPQAIMAPKTLTTEQLSPARNLGATLAAGLVTGIY